MNNYTVRQKLSVMMFLQYAIWGAWGVSIGGYMGETLQFSGAQIGAIFSTTAIGAMISPLFVGYIADRLFATEKLIGVLHLVGAALLAKAAVTTDFTLLFTVMVAYAICYMPTLALTNSISFANIADPEKDFPRIRVWGTMGWIVVGLLVGLVLDIPKGTSNNPIFLAAGLSAVLGVFSFTLPHTPPQGKSSTPSDSGGAGILQLLQNPSFLVFVVCSFLVCIPLAFYYSFANAFLTELDAPYPTALQVIGQISELGFMAAMPFFIVRLGVKKMLIVGMLAWVVRYLCFGTLQLPLIIFGLFLHGICYDFFFVASQIYVDTQVAQRQRASAQSFIAFVTLGVGMFVGTNIGGWTVDRYPPAITVRTTITDQDGEEKIDELALPNWDETGETGIAAELKLTPQSSLSIDQLPDAFSETDEKTNITNSYTSADLQAALEKADINNDGQITRVEWREAQRHGWFSIWLWPAMAALGTCILFTIGFRDPRKDAPDILEKMADEAPLGAGEGPEPQVG